MMPPPMADPPAPADDLPRVLILSHEIPQTVNAGCILLHRLFRDYPAEKLVVIGPPPDPAGERLACRYESVLPPWFRLHHTRFAGIKRSLDAYGLTPNVTPAQVRRLLGGFRPQVVVTVFEERLAAAAARYAAADGVPLALIVHDKPELIDQVEPWAAAAQVRANAKIYRSAAVRLNVSPEMERHLAELYGVAGDVMYPNRSDDLVPRDPEASADLREPPRLHVGYAGSYAYGYGHQMRAVARALRSSPVRLRAYGNLDVATDPLATELSDVVDVRGRIAPLSRLWPTVQAECDAVLLPYTWSTPDTPVELYRTHFPSKLTEYLALGMPVVVMGPTFATGVAWAVRNPGAALLLTDPDPATWAAGLTALAEDPARRVALARGASAAGARDFDPAAIRAAFLAHLRRVARA